MGKAAASPFWPLRGKRSCRPESPIRKDLDFHSRIPNRPKTVRKWPFPSPGRAGSCGFTGSRPFQRHLGVYRLYAGGTPKQERPFRGIVDQIGQEDAQAPKARAAFLRLPPNLSLGDGVSSASSRKVRHPCPDRIPFGRSLSIPFSQPFRHTNGPLFSCGPRKLWTVPLPLSTSPCLPFSDKPKRKAGFFGLSLHLDLRVKTVNFSANY
ncbi:MAG: hypothetical protein CW346_05470 [Bacillaceae bacterium]|nr:hypothetical protein [Bacillaceae bacterium]